MQIIFFTRASARYVIAVLFFVISVLTVACDYTHYAQAATVKKSVVSKITTKQKITAKKTLTLKQLLGKIVIQDQPSGRLWYVNPDTKKRYALTSDTDVQWLINIHGIGLSSSALDAVPVNPVRSLGKKSKPYSGRIVYRQGDASDAWYVNPSNGVRYSFGSFAEASSTAKFVASRVDSATVRKAPMNDEQLTYDPIFSSVASVAYDGSRYSGSSNDHVILPLASVTKLMTALVLLDLGITWDSQVVITQDEIDYPRTLVGGDATSEVDLKAGDIVRVGDLWISMLLASSNQSAIILADNSGVSREQFVALMNAKAKSLGMARTQFKEPAGLNPNNVSTARDTALMGTAALGNPLIASATRLQTYWFLVTAANGAYRTVQVANRNYSLMAFQPDGSKTGYLTEAQRNAVIKKGSTVVVVLHALSLKQRNTIIKNLLDGVSPAK